MILSNIPDNQVAGVVAVLPPPTFLLVFPWGSHTYFIKRFNDNNECVINWINFNYVIVMCNGWIVLCNAIFCNIQ